MQRRLEQLSWRRVCIWQMGPLDIRVVRNNIKQSLPPKRRFAGTRRIVQWNGVLRHDFWTPPDDIQQLITDILQKNQQWRVKLYESFQTRRPSLTDDAVAIPRPRRPQRDNDFKILTLNAQGLGQKYHVFAEYIERIAPDFALIQETRHPAGRSFHPPTTTRPASQRCHTKTQPEA